jgi:hypothetical protein
MKVETMIARELRRIVFFLALITTSAPADAQTANPPPQVRKNYDECVYLSVAEQFADKSAHDMSMVAENAFRACLTEEQALTTFMALQNVPPSMISAVLIKIKLQLKWSVRDIAANAEKYLKKQETVN